VLALWVLATAVAAVNRGPDPEGARWAATLCVCDVPVAAAVAWVALRVGFEDWPHQLDGVAVGLLVGAAALRASLASGPSDDGQEVGLLIVRTQTVVLLSIALNVGGVDRSILVGAALLGAAGFAVSGTVARAATADVVQEISLVALVLAGARLEWMPAGWEWGALAGGTLMHNLRLRLASEHVGPLAGRILMGGGFGLPLLPVALVGLEGAARARGWVGIVVLVGLVAGLGARLSLFYARPGVDGRRSRPEVEGRWQWAVATAVLGAAVVSGLWAPVLAVPRPPAGGPIAWPPVWAVGLVLLAGLAGALRPLPVRSHETTSDPTGRALPRLPDLRLPARTMRPGVIVTGLSALAAVAVAIWVIGVLRGFL
jgi:hypothetical protein